MPIKRRSSKRVAAPPRERARLTSSDEKRQLILAHAASRRPMDPIQRMSLWAGVVISVVAVVGAWAYSVGSGIQKTWAQGEDPDMQHIVDVARQFQNSAVANPSDPNDLTYQLRQSSNSPSVSRDELVGAILDQAATSSFSSSTSTPRLTR